MKQKNKGASPTKVILIIGFVLLLFIIISGYQTTQEIKNRELPNEVTKSHTNEAYKASLHFLKQNLSRDDEIYEHTLEITSREVEPEYQHIYEVKISGHYVLEDFEDESLSSIISIFLLFFLLFNFFYDR